MPRVVSSKVSPAKITDLDRLFNIPLGSLEEMQDQCEPESSKFVFKSRLRQYTVEAGKAVGLFFGECGALHGTNEGTEPLTAGIMWVWCKGTCGTKPHFICDEVTRSRFIRDAIAIKSMTTTRSSSKSHSPTSRTVRRKASRTYAYKKRSMQASPPPDTISDDVKTMANSLPKKTPKRRTKKVPGTPESEKKYMSLFADGSNDPSPVATVTSTADEAELNALLDKALSSSEAEVEALILSKFEAKPQRKPTVREPHAVDEAKPGDKGGICSLRDSEKKAFTIKEWEYDDYREPHALGKVDSSTIMPAFAPSSAGKLVAARRGPAAREGEEAVKDKSKTLEVIDLSDDMTPEAKGKATGSPLQHNDDTKTYSISTAVFSKKLNNKEPLIDLTVPDEETDGDEDDISLGSPITLDNITPSDMIYGFLRWTDRKFFPLKTSLAMLSTVEHFERKRSFEESLIVCSNQAADKKVKKRNDGSAFAKSEGEFVEGSSKGSVRK